jgi:RNA-dependent RNA polymerase
MTLAEIDRVQSIALDRDKALAWLERDGAELDSGEITMTDTAYRMIKAGHDVKEPRVQELTGRMIGAFMVSFREKLSIPVSQSAFVYGICDETRTLKENEVVVHASKYGYITGKVLVSRSPCGHPGDFRLLEAVRTPLGPQWKNCIVFPMAGRQPVADQMSGGDLDGDEFFITWNEELFPPNIVPADPRTPRPKIPLCAHQGVLG